MSKISKLINELFEKKQCYLLVNVKKQDKDKFEKIIDKSDFTYDKYNAEFSSYYFPVEDENDANNLERELDGLFKTFSVSYELED